MTNAQWITILRAFGQHFVIADDPVLCFVPYLWYTLWDFSTLPIWCLHLSQHLRSLVAGAGQRAWQASRLSIWGLWCQPVTVLYYVLSRELKRFALSLRSQESGSGLRSVASSRPRELIQSWSHRWPLDCIFVKLWQYSSLLSALIRD